MHEDTAIIPLRQPGSILDPLTEIDREGARRMLMAPPRAEADGFVARFGASCCHNTGPEWGSGPTSARSQCSVRRCAAVQAEAKIRFSCNILPKQARRSKSLNTLLPVLYTRGLSTSGVREALTAILCKARNLSPA